MCKGDNKMSLKAKEMAEYFKANTSYNRLLNGIKNKYVSLGEIKGNVIINNPDKLEKQVLSGLMKKDYSKNKSININLRILQERIDNSRFFGACLKEIIEEYFNEEILTKKETKQDYEEGIEHFFNEILNINKDTEIYEYLKEIIENKNDIYYNLKKHYNKNKNELKKAIIAVCNGINNLPNEKVRIPVFASKITGNPHSFDKSTLCGKIFIMLLCHINKTQKLHDTEGLAELYYNNNLLIDDVSNMVLCKNVIGYRKREEYEENGQNQKYTVNEQHKGLMGFFEYNEPIYLNLYNLSNISYFDEYHKYNEVVVMENPAVFMEVSERCNKKDFPIVCTYGQVKLAGIVLLDMFVEQRYTIHYSGDIDPEGIQIADKLKQRYGEKLKFIGYNKETYYSNISEVKLPESRLKKLENIKSSELQVVCNELKETKKASYEEKNIEQIIEFINEI